MTQNEAKEGVKVYEIGFHIAPTVSEENLVHEVNKIKDVLQAEGSSVVSEDFPRLRALTYPIAKHIQGSNKKYKEGYFGWIKFEGSPESAVALKKAVDTMENVIRFLIIKTVKENTLYGTKFASKSEMKKKTEEKPAGEPISAEELDKTIDSLVV